MEGGGRAGERVEVKISVILVPVVDENIRRLEVSVDNWQNFP